MPNDSLPLNDVTSEGSLNKDDILDILAEDDSGEDNGEQEKSRPEEKVKEGQRGRLSETESEEEQEEVLKLKGALSEEDDDEEKVIPEEELEVAVPVKRKQILEKYPNVFKDFPYLEKAYYRDEQFTQVFPTIREAREASDKAQTFDRFEGDVMQGNTEKVLLAIREGDERAFRKAVDNYLPTLAKVDQGAFLHVIGNVLRHALSNVSNEGRRRGEAGEPLTIASRIIAQHLFGTENPEPTPLLVQDDERVNQERQQISQERQEYIREKFEGARGDLAERIQNSLKATISANIDPKNSMTDYIRRNASRDAYELLETQMRGDTRFTTIMNTLWKRAFNEGFSKTSMDRIKSAYLSKAKTVLPTVIKQSRNDALKSGQSRKESADTKDRPIALGKTTASITRGKSTSDPKGIPKGMKTIDYLSGSD